MANIQVSARVALLIGESARAAGVDQAEVFAAAALDPALLTQADARIPLEVEDALWETAARLSNDPAFGLHTAERLRAGRFDALDYAIRTSATLRDALARLCRYNALVHDAAAFAVRETPRGADIEHGFPSAARGPSRHAAEFTLAAVVVVARQLSGTSIAARRVTFHHAAPASVRDHTRLFGIEPRFRAPSNTLTLERGVLDMPVRAGDPKLAAILDRHIESLLATLPRLLEEAVVSQRVRRALIEALRAGEPSVRSIATALDTSTRSLQRHLATEGTSFEKVLEDLRRELADGYLRDSTLAIGEIAFLLGYSEPSAFHRAFKRWHGETPSERRRR